MWHLLYVVCFQPAKRSQQVDPSAQAREEDELARAIAASLKDSDKGASKSSSSGGSLYPTSTSAYPSAMLDSRPREIRKVSFENKYGFLFITQKMNKNRKS